MLEKGRQNWKKLNLLIKIGIIIFAIGSGPLLIIGGLSEIGIGDPNPNPVFAGIMFSFTFLPSIGLVLIGIGKTIWDKI